MAQALPSAARSSRSWRTSSRPTGPSPSLPRYAATWAARSALASKIAARGEMAEWSNAADSKSVVPIGYRGFESLSLRHTPASNLDAQIELLHRRARFELARGAFERDAPRLEHVGARRAGKRHRRVLLGQEN